MSPFLMLLLAIFSAGILGVPHASPTSQKVALPPETPADVVQYIQALAEQHPTIPRETAIKELGRMGVRAAPAAPFLIELWDYYGAFSLSPGGPSLYDTRSKQIRDDLIRRALLGIGEPAIKPLMEAIRTSGASLSRKYAAETLGEMDTPNSRDALLAILLSDHPNRLDALSGINRYKIPDVRTVPPLIEILNRPDLLSQLNPLGVVYLLAKTKDRQAVDTLRAVLNSDDKAEVREAAACALGEEMLDPSVTEALLTMLRESVFNQHCAAQALGTLGTDRAVLPLIESMEVAIAKADHYLADTAWTALRQITKQNLGQDPAKWRAWLRGRGK